MESVHSIVDEGLLQKMACDALVWSSLHGLVVGDRSSHEIRLGLHRSDYMLDEPTKSLLQIEMNTISSSFPGLSCLVSELHRNLLANYGEHIGLDSKRVPTNNDVTQFAEALAKAWTEYNNPSEKVIMNEQSGYLMRTKIASSNEGGVAAGFAVLDSVYLS